MTAVFKTSHKENEKRIPIYPDHIHCIPLEVRKELVFEINYGEDYGFSNADIIKLGCQVASREELFELCDTYILPKPVAEDLKQMKNGGVLCGWTHAVQQRDITDLALEKKLTLIAWEEMNHASKNGKLHIFYRNNELAGYAGVLHYLELMGLDGHYGERKNVVVLGYGAVSRGAIYALQGRGFNNITVYTQRLPHLVADKNPDVWYSSFVDETGFKKSLEEADIIFNGILQDVNKPLMYISNDDELAKIKDHAAIIDISCDKGMGFYFAEPTSFENPIISLERGIKYYSVDHTPTYLWHAASREISKALYPYLEYIVNRDKWRESDTVYNAIDIKEGMILNQNIIKFQNR